MDWTQIITHLLTLLAGGGLVGVYNWKNNKAKAAEGVKTDAIENMRKAMEDFYKPIIDDQNHRIGGLLQENQELRQEVQTLRAEITEIYKFFSDMGIKAFKAKAKAKEFSTKTRK